MSVAIIFAGAHVSLTIIYAAWLISKAIIEAGRLPEPPTTPNSRSGQ